MRGFRINLFRLSDQWNEVQRIYEIMLAHLKTMLENLR